MYKAQPFRRLLVEAVQLLEPIGTKDRRSSAPFLQSKYRTLNSIERLLKV
jgi:hypothetical protein